MAEQIIMKEILCNTLCNIVQQIYFDIEVVIHYGPMGAIWTKKKKVNFNECSDTKVVFP